MSITEFELIDRYFRRHQSGRDDVVLGIGDDAALVRVREGHELVVATDTLVAGVHFPANTTPADIGHRALAVNLSDLAAMGAEPAWATLALTMPEAEESWLKGFAIGFFALAARHRVELIGGDTTRGPLTITVAVHGWVPSGQALRRSGARIGDRIYISGTLGDAALALSMLREGREFPAAQRAFLSERLFRPLPRVDLGIFLRGRATSAIDVSDGLAADLGHILEVSGGGAVIESGRLPLSPAMQALAAPGQALTLSLTGGDDYELCFTVPEAAEGELAEWAQRNECPLARAGRIVVGPGLRLIDAVGSELKLEATGYRHF
ncbi:MAG: thiamine-phosphate kinase [Chromatiales bacterium]